MARIPDEMVERLKNEVALASLVDARGIELRRVGQGPGRVNRTWFSAALMRG